MSPPKVRITFCAECGYEPQALDLAKAVLLRFGDRVGSVELVPWLDGTYEVSVDGELVHAMSREGGFAPHQRVIAAVSARLGGADR